MSQCTDRVIGNILAGWRYDISMLAPEMREDYERHFVQCAHCRSRQKLHRGIDIGLMALATMSAFVFVLAFAVIRHFEPRHAFVLELASIAGFFLSAFVWLLVAVATPAPVVVVAAAKSGARTLHDRLPENIREKLPEEIRTKIIG
ncbi:hypothetical protein Acid345_4325 [Candidatus Koribacter versatilis Ellin345]|uniref:Uncharacterized protein n=1 Tax=Koribacter versatilis (strain Ellin345) TaxID=204669 RepID=Q1IIH5_KORVE|nr:hypothetical protein [Candidatus Koribacter versatilis]ABF43325.1 hypothetical protein Acid345_4325 [Candidatus Koribacter versatilis Ellin345]